MNDKKLAQVFHYDLYGKREEKYSSFINNSIRSLNWKQIEVSSPNYFFIQKNLGDNDKYESYYSIANIFKINNAGLATEFDEFVIKDSASEVVELKKNLLTLKEDEILRIYNLDNKCIEKVKRAISDIRRNQSIITNIDYRPFDTKVTLYTGFSNGFMGRPRDGIMKHLLNENIAILTCRQQRTSYFRHVFISKNISERCLVSLQTGEVNYVFPIYLYTEDAKNKESTYIRESNINESYIIKFSEKVKLTYNADNKSTKESFTLVELFEYIYAILHSPTYRAKYKEFLKIDFPRIPYPKDQATFWQFVKLGGELRQIHLLESPIVERFITSYPVTGNNEVGKVRYEDGKVRINESQYFDHVPQVAWEFYIGGYQPAQKWLKDRKGRQLSFEDVRHYQKIIVALTETDRIMREIDKAEFE